MSEVSNNQVFGVPSQNPDLRDSILSVSKQDMIFN